MRLGTICYDIIATLLFIPADSVLVMSLPVGYMEPPSYIQPSALVEILRNPGTSTKRPIIIDVRDTDYVGGHIRSAVLNACLQSASAAKGERRLRMEDVVVAVRRELEKADRRVGLERFGPYADVIGKLNMPPSYVILDRVVWGVSAILGKLEAHGPWRRMLLEYRCGHAPVTELGEAELAWRS